MERVLGRVWEGDFQEHLRAKRVRVRKEGRLRMVVPRKESEEIRSWKEERENAELRA